MLSRIFENLVCYFDILLQLGAGVIQVYAALLQKCVDLHGRRAESEQPLQLAAACDSLPMRGPPALRETDPSIAEPSLTRRVVRSESAQWPSFPDLSSPAAGLE